MNCAAESLCFSGVIIKNSLDKNKHVKLPQLYILSSKVTKAVSTFSQ